MPSFLKKHLHPAKKHNKALATVSKSQVYAPPKAKCVKGFKCGVGPNVEWTRNVKNGRVGFKDRYPVPGEPNPKRSFIPGVVGSSLPSTKISNPVPMQNREHKNLASSETWAKGSLGRVKNGKQISYSRYHK